MESRKNKRETSPANNSPVKIQKQEYNYTTDLPRKQSANLIRLRIGHCRLNSYLNRHKIIEDLSCDCGRRIETVKHYLLLCKKSEEPRNELRKEVG